jgi:hypothetical protein
MSQGRKKRVDVKLCVTKFHLEPGVEEKYLDRSFRCKNLTGIIVTADGAFGGRIVWVKMLRGRFVGGRIVKVPYNRNLGIILLKGRDIDNTHKCDFSIHRRTPPSPLIRALTLFQKHLRIRCDNPFREQC